MFKIFIIDNDKKWRNFLKEALSQEYELSFWPDGTNLFRELKSVQYDVILFDLHLERGDPFDLLNWINITLPSSPVIVTSDEEKAELVVKAIKHGAHDFVAKPFTAPKIRHSVEQVLERWSLKKEIDYLRREQDVIYDFDKIIAFSPNMKDVIDILKKFSRTEGTILMRGETGTGKSFLSGTIHFNSNRRKRPFVKINCSNIPETLLESELFGHEKGAFTGAEKLRIGRFEQAHGGTMFLDEIGELTLSLQAKLLRVLERVGGNQTIHSDVRVIAATNRDLEEHILEGKFREDLYYRLNILSVMLPPLREREKCLEPLAGWILSNKCRNFKKKISGFSQPVMEMIKAHQWPGNIRQLANVIERAVILEEGPIIAERSVLISGPMTIPETKIAPGHIDNLAQTEKDLVVAALEKTMWIQKDAAALLGISPRALNYKIKKFDITHPRWRKHK